jgi:predicted nucleotidyltransferase
MTSRADAALEEYGRVLARARVDPAVVGVVVFGSRAAGAYADDRSDVDAFVIVDGADDEARRWQTSHGSVVELWAMTLDQFRAHALPGDAAAWNRPALIRARVDLDKLDGEIGRIVDRKRRLDPEEAASMAKGALDDAINGIYRALRNAEGGRRLASRLDAIEAIGPVIATAFALEGRVRPWNKWLEFELAAEPLVDPELTSLVDLVDAVVRDPAPGSLRALFRPLEQAARRAGHGGVVDAWEPDLAWLRGEAPYRA